METILEALVFFHLVELKRSKCLIQTYLMIELQMGSDIGQTTSEMGSAPSTELLVILYLRLNRLGAANLSCARLLHKGLSQ